MPPAQWELNPENGIGLLEAAEPLRRIDREGGAIAMATMPRPFPIAGLAVGLRLDRTPGNLGTFEINEQRQLGRRRPSCAPHDCGREKSGRASCVGEPPNLTSPYWRLRQQRCVSAWLV